MLHCWDTHYWIAKTPKGFISAEDHCSADPEFKEATWVRIEPLTSASIQAVLQADIPKGYTAFLRTDPIIEVVSGKMAGLNYILALEKGEWSEPGKVALSEVPLKDGFRAELRTVTGEVDFQSSDDFYFEKEDVCGLDVYKFIKR